MDPTRRLPANLAEHALTFEDGTRTPVEPRDASTVVLMRGGSEEPGSLEVYLLRRHVDMAFAAGMFVFPGGGVDRRDFDREIGWVGPSAEEWSRLLGTDEALARVYDYVLAIRKTPIVVNDSRGFFTSRVIGTFVNEAIGMLGEGSLIRLIATRPR